MSTLRPLLSPLAGTAVAAVVLYSMAGTLSTRTHQLSESLHMSSHSLRRLAQVDDTEDLLSKGHVAPDAITMANSWEKFKDGEKEKLRAAYTLPSRPSLREEVKARWNGYLFAGTRFFSETDIDHVIDGTTSLFSNFYARIRGHPTSDESGTISRWTGDALYKAKSATASVTGKSEPATLREPLPPRHDLRLDAPNTHYAGQGASLR